MAPPLLCVALPLLLFFLPRHPTAASSNTLRAGEHISTNDTLVSSDSKFVLGFYTSSPTSIYLAIWYNALRIKRPVWVANRDRPLRSSAGNLTLSPSSSSLLLTDSQGIVWSAGAGAGAVAPSSAGAYADLDSSGNLVLYGGDSGTLWESADHPTDTILAGTKLWSNRAAGTASSLQSWSSELDPSPGNLTFEIDRRNPAQFVMWRGSQAYWRSNVWGGAPSAGITMGRYIIYLTIARNMSWTNVSFSFNDATKILRLNYTGTMDLLEWNRETADWSIAYRFPALSCEVYSSCGPFGVCDGTVEPASCKCLDGFEPKNRTEWGSGRYGGGCVRILGPVCGGGDEMVPFGNMKLPDQFVLRSDLDTNGCSGNCTRNCSCTAYAYSDRNSSPDPASSWTGCLMWFGELIDMARQNDIGVGAVLYVRIASSKKGNGYQAKVITVVASLLGAIVFTALVCFTWKHTKYLRDKCNSGRDRKENEEALPGIEGFNIHAEQGNLDLPLLDFEVLVSATDNFSDSLKIGQGGFGKVYKGILPSGVEVAIKRLSKGSGQGLEEFKNEVILIAQIQHRNLVRLLGCCLKGGERLLIYEYMPNKSLDFFLFGDIEKEVLDWERRFSIIKGIARGLLYLHEDSRLTIIHRDLKASNVLLDGDMNPRISDFGMARIFGGNQNQANTVRIAGTYGYMSPEYAMEVIFSVKSDVYSFGVLLLEIITGQRNTGFRHDDKYFSLLSYAWEMRNDGKLTDIVDPLLGDSFSIREVERCVHIGLLCVQDRTKNRPTMSSVVFMLENSSPIDAVPQKPTFTPEVKHAESSSTQGRTPDTASLNSLTVTGVQCR